MKTRGRKINFNDLLSGDYSRQNLVQPDGEQAGGSGDGEQAGGSGDGGAERGPMTSASDAKSQSNYTLIDYHHSKIFL